MKRSILALAAAVAVAAGLAVARLSAGPESTPKAPALPQGRIEGAQRAIVAVSTRGNIRTVTLDASIGSGNTSTYNVAPEAELNITSATFAAGVGTPGEIFQSYAYLSYFDDSGAIIAWPVYFASSGTQTLNVTFPDPVPMRAGDQFVFLPFRAASPGTSVNCVVSLTGTVPAAVTGAVVR